MKYDFMRECGLKAVNTGVIINGAALILVGDKFTNTADVRLALTLWLFGVLASAVAYMLAMYSALHGAEEDGSRSNNRFRDAQILVFVSYGLFVAGSLTAIWDC